MAGCSPCQWISARYALALLSFLGFVNVYMLRVNLSVALVAMVKDITKNTTEINECPDMHTPSNTSTHPAEGVYNWNRSLQGTILGAFFYGYIVTQIPGGWLAGKYGGKKLFGVGILCTAVFTLVTPIAAEWSVYVLIVTRILEGLGEGVTFPAMHAMWAEWAPPLERSKLVTLSYAGAQFGTVIGLPLAGVITDYLGWEYVFYIFGGIAIVWFFLWMVTVHDTPDDHPRISDEEKHYILTSIQANRSSKKQVTLANTPWLEFAKSPAVWAVSIAHFSHNWGFYTLLTCLPTYMKDVLKFDLSQDSLISCLPYLTMWLSIWIGGAVVDTIRERRIATTTTARKSALAIGLLGPAFCLIGVGYVGCNYVLAIVLLCLAGAFDGISLSGFNVNHLDIAPQYAGTLMGITNCIATIPGFLGPQIAGWLTSNGGTSAEWRNVFYISAEVYIFGVCMFTILGSGEEQEWAKYREDEEVWPVNENSALLSASEDKQNADF